MRVEMTMANDKDSPIIARPLFAFEGEQAGLEFKQDDFTIILVTPPHMHSCLETIARVFNECMDAEPHATATIKTSKPGPYGAATVAAPADRGQYIGLTRADDDVPVGGLTSLGNIRGPDDGAIRTFVTGGVVLVTPEVAVDAARFGWKYANGQLDRDGLIAIERPAK